MLIILGSTYEKAPAGFAGIAIGLALTLIHLVSIPVTNTSVNPARSISQAVFVGGWALSQLWLFIVVPIVAAWLAGVIARIIRHEHAVETPVFEPKVSVFGGSAAVQQTRSALD